MGIVHAAMNEKTREHLAWRERPKGWPVELETARFRLRSLVRADASEKWAAWVADAEAMAPLHMPARKVSVEELAAHIALFDNDSRLLVGIFARENGAHIGFHMIEVDKAHALAAFHAFVGERAWWGKDVVNETRAALLDHFFGARGIDKAIGQPLERDFGALLNFKKQGWRLEGVHRRQRRSVLTGARVDQYAFAMQRDEWRALRTAPA